MKQKFVLGFIFNKDLDKVLLIKKNRGPKNVEKMAGKLNGIGGHLEKSELPIQGIIRECKEETGLVLGDWNYYCLLDAKFGEVYCFYTVTDEVFDYKQIEDEELNIYRIDDFDEYTTEKYDWVNDNERMANLDWLIPMALNHYKKLDETAVFEVRETC